MRKDKSILINLISLSLFAGCSPAGSSGGTAEAPVPAALPTRPAPLASLPGQFAGATSDAVSTQNDYKMSGVVGSQESQIVGTTQGGYKVFMTIKGAELSKPPSR